MKLKKLHLSLVATCLGLMLTVKTNAQCDTTIAALDGIDTSNANTDSSVTGLVDDGNNGNNIGGTSTTSWITFKNLTLDCANSVNFSLANKNNRQSVIDIRIGDETGTVIGTTEANPVGATGGWQTYLTFSAGLDLSTFTAGDDITFTFRSLNGGTTNLFNFRDFTFSPDVITGPVIIPLTPATECSLTLISALDGVDENNLNTSSSTLVAETNNVGSINNTSYITFHSLDLSCVASVDFSAASNRSGWDGVIDVRIGDETGTVIGSTSELIGETIDATGGWQVYKTFSTDLDLSTYTVGNDITLTFRNLADNTGSFVNLRDITFIEDTTLSSNEILAIDASISPNPTTGVVNVTSAEGEDFDLTVLNINGKTLLTDKGTQIDLTGLAQGVYIIKGQTGNKSFTKRVLKK